MNIMTHTLPLQRQLAFLSLSLASAIVLAQAVDHLEANPDYDDRVIDEIFESAGEWRQSPPTPAAKIEWRVSQEPIAPESRIRIGADSAYEEMRNRNDDRYRNIGGELDQLRPSTVLKFSF